MTNPYPLPRSFRASPPIAGDGNATYGPFAFKIWDPADIIAEVDRGTGNFALEPVTVAKLAGLLFDDFTVRFSPALTFGQRAVVISRRLHERSTDVTRGGSVSTNGLEGELSRQGTVLQELRRDSNQLDVDLSGERLERISADSLEATLRALGDSFLRGLIGDYYAKDTLNPVPISSRAAAEIALIGPALTHLLTGGFAAPGFGGEGLYRRGDGAKPGGFFSGDGAGWELVRGDVVDIRQFGAVADWNGFPELATDNWQALEDARDFLGLLGGRIRVVGQYYKSKTTVIETNVTFYGDGATGSSGNNSVVVVPAGVTAFIGRSSAGFTSRAADWCIENIDTRASGKNTNTVTGTIAAGTRILTLSAPGDFENGQIIYINGAGYTNDLANPNVAKADCEAGNPTITCRRFGNSASVGMCPGMVVNIVGAGLPAGTYVVSTSNSGSNGTVVLSNAPTISVPNASIKYSDDLRTQIISGGGTTTLTLGVGAATAATGAIVGHYDCGVFSTGRFRTDGVWVTRDFAGAGILLCGSGITPTGSAANVNGSVLNYGYSFGNKNNVVIMGVNGNIVKINDVYTHSSSAYCFVDESFLGSLFNGTHAQGANGCYMTVYPNAYTKFNGCYSEPGHPCSFSRRTTVDGGTLGGARTGNVHGGAVRGADIDFGMIMSSSRFGLEGLEYLVTVGGINQPISIGASAVGGPAVMQFKPSSSGLGQAGLWGWFVGSPANNVGAYFTDESHPWGAGWNVTPRGTYIGRGLASLATSNFRKRTGTIGAPTSGEAVRGDVWEEFNLSSGGSMYYVCTTSGTIGSTAVIKTAGAIAA
ncbi:hypothetical protein GTW51_10010 [Aurantimonas aggregata]|uniref:Uncharacterized protein n=1 Tax=Aurantimonas aggregata TaxID=2047720 RepID=A0A6L9MGT7_9HYPH|nr:hypothetical protein [Aurantimonas aggregata]NDV87035.1 hypothetical protein [Aurantimonas aggregata]